ncbi:hypothetical protein BaRGS_00013526, partial [Batillaria attramentaria]
MMTALLLLSINRLSDGRARSKSCTVFHGAEVVSPVVQLPTPSESQSIPRPIDGKGKVE